jgi:hypothetical protein
MGVTIRRAACRALKPIPSISIDFDGFAPKITYAGGIARSSTAATANSQQIGLPQHPARPILPAPM